MLKNREYTTLVENGVYPEDPEVSLDPPFENANGQICNLLLENFRSAALISSVEGAVRANHYHKTDWHYTYVLSGQVVYYWRPAGSLSRPEKKIFRQDKMFFTPPMVEHAMFFPQASEIVTFAKNIRDSQSHEEDVVRVSLIRSEPCLLLVPGEPSERDETVNFIKRFKVTFPRVDSEGEIV